jgi:hypothetical protein
LLCEQGLLRDVEEKLGTDFAATCQKWLRTRDQCYIGRYRRDDRSGLRIVGSAIFVFAHSLARSCSTAARGSLYVSHLIHGL